MTFDDLEVGRTYRGRQPRGVFEKGTQHINDRRIIEITEEGEVRFDTPGLRLGRRLTMTGIKQFMAWAAYDCTNEFTVLDYEWLPWPMTCAQQARLKQALEVACRFDVVQETNAGHDAVLGSFFRLYDAEVYLNRCLDEGLDAYLVLSEE
ncbi:hypothetical protein [Larsenimonas suaedae]|uniref:Uncharacterized protein n=1 Tax=Larsenimonas suaedae TaxID=1851019 RepID=A0ABU1H0G1_9GAMM|nr:hypothetical protein [Larsenimonas suaedae]MCM2973767.1 hypothetical protein [Larsenimonas suaedae]MDR5897291.1 hypothetical protein [Larsenimonas suaedae]